MKVSEFDNTDIESMSALEFRARRRIPGKQLDGRHARRIIEDDGPNLELQSRRLRATVPASAGIEERTMIKRLAHAG